MADISAEQIVDRVRSILCSVPFEFTEAVSWDTFDLQPQPNIDKVFRIVPLASQGHEGGFDFIEDRTETLQIVLARQHREQWDEIRRLFTRDVRSLTAALMHDAYQVSGDYALPDAGRGHTVEPLDPTATYAVLRLTIPVNYETRLIGSD